MTYLRLPSRCKLHLRSCGNLRSIDWQLHTGLSGQPVGPSTRFGGTYTKIGTIQRRLAWPLYKDDTQNREAFYIFCGPGSVVGIATGYGLDGPGIESQWGARFSAPVQTGPGAHPTSCTMGTGSFLGIKSGRGVTLTPHSLLVPWSRKGRAIPLLPLWVVRPVQSLSPCTRVHFTFYFCWSHLQGVKESKNYQCTLCNTPEE